jgi:hypothetical protein
MVKNICTLEPFNAPFSALSVAHNMNFMLWAICLLSVEELTPIEGGKATPNRKDYVSPLVTPIPVEEACAQAPAKATPFYFFPERAFFAASTAFVAADLTFPAA